MNTKDKIIDAFVDLVCIPLIRDLKDNSGTSFEELTRRRRNELRSVLGLPTEDKKK